MSTDIEDNKLVVCEFKITVLISMPANWNEKDFQDRFVDGTFCNDNIIDGLVDAMSDSHCLTCPNSTLTYIRDATDDDQNNLTIVY
jgi:hypothetical protein